MVGTWIQCRIYGVGTIRGATDEDKHDRESRQRKASSGPHKERMKQSPSDKG